MKAFNVLVTAVAFATGALAAPAASTLPAPLLLQPQAEEIVNKYISILEQKNYRGQTPEETNDEIIAPDYIVRSDSILSLISPNSTVSIPYDFGIATDSIAFLASRMNSFDQAKNEHADIRPPHPQLGADAPNVFNDRSSWFEGMSTHPESGIQTLDVFVAGNSNILWYWIFPEVGNRRYPVKGFNLLRVNADYQIYEADIEFNSIAWGADTNRIDAYCPA